MFFIFQFIRQILLILFYQSFYFFLFPAFFFYGKLYSYGSTFFFFLCCCFISRINSIFVFLFYFPNSKLYHAFLLLFCFFNFCLYIYCICVPLQMLDRYCERSAYFFCNVCIFYSKYILSFYVLKRVHSFRVLHYEEQKVFQFVASCSEVNPKKTSLLATSCTYLS